MPLKNMISALLGRKQSNAVLEPSTLDPRSVLDNLATALPESLKYEWDDRFDGILAAFAVAEKESILSILNSQFGHSWDSASIGGAPANIKSAIKEFGGLTSEQHLFACALSEKVVLLGFWWPWGNGATISIRFIPFGLGTLDTELNEVRTFLKEAFEL